MAVTVGTTPATSPTKGTGRRGELLAIAAERIAERGYARTSLRDVADDAGILAGSLYHHFPSKEAIAVELVEAFHCDLERLAGEAAAPGVDAVAAILDFAQRLGQVTARHRAAVQLCQYDAPASTSGSLSALVRHRSPGLARRWAELVRAARPDLRPDLDPVLLQALLHRAVLEVRSVPGGAGPREVAGTLARVVLSGIAVSPPPARELAGSAAAAVARSIGEKWAATAAVAPEGRRAVILSAAREEFARRGFEATTVRNIAESASIRGSSLYRHFPSKEAILGEMMELFSGRLLCGFEAVMRAGDRAVPTLDALVAVMSTAATLFRADFAVLKDWWRTLDRSAPDSALRQNAARLSILQGLVDDGIRDGEFVASYDREVLAVVLRGIMWLSMDVPDLTADRRHDFLSFCILRGAAAQRL